MLLDPRFLHGDAGLPALKGAGDALLDKVARRDGVRLEEEPGQSAAELGEPHPFPQVRQQRDADRFAGILLALGPDHAAVGSYARWKTDAASEDGAGGVVHVFFPFSPGMGKQRMK